MVTFLFTLFVYPSCCFALVYPYVYTWSFITVFQTGTYESAGKHSIAIEFSLFTLFLPKIIEFYSIKIKLDSFFCSNAELVRFKQHIIQLGLFFGVAVYIVNFRPQRLIWTFCFGFGFWFLAITKSLVFQEKMICNWKLNCKMLFKFLLVKRLRNQTGKTPPVSKHQRVCWDTSVPLRNF